MITRRLFAGMLPGAAISAPSILKTAAQSLGQDAAPSSFPNGYAEAGQSIEKVRAIAPKMTHEAALEQVRKLPWIRDKLREYYREQAKNVTTIDYDILIKKSWSDMYKVTVQAERNLERLVDRVLDQNKLKVTNYPFHEIIHKMMWG